MRYASKDSVIVLALSGLILLISLACGRNQQPLFQRLDAQRTGIIFKNYLPEDDSLNLLDYLYYYNGGGVALLDVNGDGLQDIFFTANKKGGNKLYLNKGAWQFEDITATAGVAGRSDWTTGVTVTDVNDDGLPDLYVCALAGKLNLNGRNALYVNNGNNTFSEKAADYGLDFSGYSTQAAFFDYDKDGDLDCYLLNQSDHAVDVIKDTSGRRKRSNLAGDCLYRNEHGVFKNVTADAGIYNSALGYGLGLAVGDLNGDGWDDLYIGNDFHENDYCYLNNRNGTFTESSRGLFGHMSRFSMGNDIADYNNDGLLDVITVDMLPEDEKILKTYAGDDAADIYAYKITGNGFQYQYSRNMLQRNDGAGHFSEVGLMSGVSATDWSWAPLFADFDLDGIKDLFITNGIGRRASDLDYVKFISNQGVQVRLSRTKAFDKQVLQKMPLGAVPNFLFQGTAQQRFVDRSAAWGFEKVGLSNGAAYGDLDNDGDLDLVVNNINEEAGLYQNNVQRKNYLSIKLQGGAGNRFGIGAKVYVYSRRQMQLLQQSLTRGFQSAVSPVLITGLDTASVVDSLKIVWPDLRQQMLRRVAANQTLTLRQQDAVDSVDSAELFQNPIPLFTDVSDSLLINWQHRENLFFDFNQQYLIPHQLSTLGPRVAVADVNRDGFDDFFVCGALGQGSALFLQNARSQFELSMQPLFDSLRQSEAVAATFADVNGDGYPDLYVASGGNQFRDGAPQLEDHLFINDAKGGFYPAPALPPLRTNKSCVTAADIDGDGDVDLFVGSRSVAGAYGQIPESYLLQNDGRGNFAVVTDAWSKELKKAGMVSDAAFADVDKDNKPDLILMGEWMPLRVFRNNGSTFTPQPTDAATTGWWQRLHAADMDGDGDLDIVAGNYGLNSKLTASSAYPLKMYLLDYDGNGKTDPLLCAAKNGQYYTFLGKDELEKELPILKKQFLEYTGFAGKNVREVFGNALDKAMEFSAATLASALFVNDGHGNFSMHALPDATQTTPLFALATQLQPNGLQALFCAGNFYGVLPYEGRYDASQGSYLQQTTAARFKTVPTLRSGLHITGEARDLQWLRLVNGKTALLVARNNAPLLMYAPAP